MQRSIIGLAIALFATATALSSCSSSDSPLPTQASSTTTSSTTKPADCTKAGLAEAAKQAALAMGSDNIYTIDDVKCADDDWAVTSGLLASQANPDTGAPTSFVFQRNGDAWLLQDKTKVCGTHPTTTPAPVDATIPDNLYQVGCLT
jgi:hypothetical protein